MVFFRRIILFLKRVKFGKNLNILGPLRVRGEVNGESVLIGSNVTFQPNVDLKVRKNGKIIIGNNVQLDFGVRVVVAENYKVEISDGVRIGHSTILNGGCDIRISENVAIAGHSLLQASEHVLDRKSKKVVGTEYKRGPILIGKSSWICSHVVIRPNTRIGKNCIVGAQSLVQGDFNSFLKIAGSPAKVIGSIQ